MFRPRQRPELHASLAFAAQAHSSSVIAGNRPSVAISNPTLPLRARQCFAVQPCPPTIQSTECDAEMMSLLCVDYDPQPQVSHDISAPHAATHSAASLKRLTSRTGQCHHSSPYESQPSADSAIRRAATSSSTRRQQHLQNIQPSPESLLSSLEAALQRQPAAQRRAAHAASVAQRVPTAPVRPSAPETIVQSSLSPNPRGNTQAKGKPRHWAAASLEVPSRIIVQRRQYAEQLQRYMRTAPNTTSSPSEDFKLPPGSLVYDGAVEEPSKEPRQSNQESLDHQEHPNADADAHSWMNRPGSESASAAALEKEKGKRASPTAGRPPAFPTKPNWREPSPPRRPRRPLSDHSTDVPQYEPRSVTIPRRPVQPGRITTMQPTLPAVAEQRGVLSCVKYSCVQDGSSGVIASSGGSVQLSTPQKQPWIGVGDTQLNHRSVVTPFITSPSIPVVAQRGQRDLLAGGVVTRSGPVATVTIAAIHCTQ